MRIENMVGDPSFFEVKNMLRSCRLWFKLLIILFGLFCLPLSVSAAQSVVSTKQASPLVRVPVVGCPADGQVGFMRAERRGVKAVRIPAAQANRLAFYKAHDLKAILAPRGWHGFGTYGSSGANLFLTPKPTVKSAQFSKSISGPMIQLSSELAGTSGRFGVARTIARIFPDHKDFVEQVIAEKIEPASDFPYGPYANDKLTYLSKNMVEFHTPANKKGLGTEQSFAAKSGDPIDGVVILSIKEGSPEEVIMLTVRLTPETRDLKSTIFRQFERDFASGSYVP